MVFDCVGHGRVNSTSLGIRITGGYPINGSRQPRRHLLWVVADSVLTTDESASSGGSDEIFVSRATAIRSWYR